MSISGISFWQQDQAWRSRRQAQDQQLSFTGSLTSVVIGALANQTTGLASIANRQALNRVNAQIAAAQGGSSNASASSSKSASGVPTSSATNLLSGATASGP